MRCPRCKSDQRVKDGIVKGRQRYQCKACGFRYTVEYKSGITPYFKRLALMMYLEGLGFRSIGRILGVSNVAVLNWVRDFGMKAGDLPEVETNLKQVEIDEMHTYIGSKKTEEGSGMLLISWEHGGYNVLLATGEQRQDLGFGKK